MNHFRCWSILAITVTLLSGIALLGCPDTTVTTGALAVQILPTGALQAGAQWRLDGGEWHDSGELVSELDAGAHAITFKPISNWLTPPQQSVLIQSGQTAGATGQYAINLAQAVTLFGGQTVSAESAGDELFASYVRTSDLSGREEARKQLRQAVTDFVANGGSLTAIKQRSNAISCRFYSDKEVNNRYTRKHPSYAGWEELEHTNLILFINGVNVGLPGFIEDAFALEDVLESLDTSQDLGFLALWVPGGTPDIDTIAAGDQALLQWIATIPNATGYPAIEQDVAEHLLLLQAAGHNVILVPHSTGNVPIYEALNAMTTQRSAFNVIETGSNTGPLPTGLTAQHRIDITNDAVAKLSTQYGTGDLLLRNSTWTIQESLFYVVGKNLATWSDTSPLAVLLTNHSFIGSYLQDSSKTVIQNKTTQYCVPVVRAMAINTGASTTTSLNVTLNNNCLGIPTEYMASETEDFSTSTGWKTYAGGPSFTLSSGEGTKTVWFKVRTEFGRESAAVQDSITFNEPHPVLSVTPSTKSVTAAAGTTSFNVINSGTGTMNWTAAVSSGDWIHITTGASGSNDTGESQSVQISYDANTVQTPRTATILVTSTGTTGSPIVVSILQAAMVPDQPILSVTPLSRNVNATAGTTTFAIANTGTGSMTWSTTVTNGTWLRVSGTTSSTITVAYDANTDVVNSRTGTIRITATGATGSPIDVTVVQEAADNGSHPAGTVRTFAGIEFVWCPPGVFKMGSPSSEVGRSSTEDPQHTVILTRGFWMSKYECTQQQWTDIMGSNPSMFQGTAYGETDNFPVEEVSWTNVQTYISKLNTAYPGLNFRLPTEAEWEYACRAGKTTRFYWGDDPNYTYISLFAWIADNSFDRTHACGGKAPNNWNLYDMSGNVQEWVQDWFGTYSAGSITNPTGSLTGTTRVMRGGCWYYDDDSCRSAKRRNLSYAMRNNYTGFRLAKY